MRKRTNAVCLAALLVGSFHMDAGAQSATLEECQKMKDKIDHYNDLRREGGSGAQMDAWKRARRKLEQRFRDEGCRSYLWELE